MIKNFYRISDERLQKILFYNRPICVIGEFELRIDQRKSYEILKEVRKIADLHESPLSYRLCSIHTYLKLMEE